MSSQTSSSDSIRKNRYVAFLVFLFDSRDLCFCSVPCPVPQSWADAFRSSPSLVGVVYVYDDLRRRGLEFPMTDLDALSPIHTPNRVRLPTPVKFLQH